jgi:hypothetical protein
MSQDEHPKRDTCADPLVGDLTLAFEMFELPADPGLSMLTYSAEPGSPSEQAVRDFARWSETRTKLSAARVRDFSVLRSASAVVADSVLAAAAR